MQQQDPTPTKPYTHLEYESPGSRIFFDTLRITSKLGKSHYNDLNTTAHPKILVLDHKHTQQKYWGTARISYLHWVCVLLIDHWAAASAGCECSEAELRGIVDANEMHSHHCSCLSVSCVAIDISDGEYYLGWISGLSPGREIRKG